jgi:hypothetical protein
MNDDSKKDSARPGPGKSGDEGFDDYLAGNSPVSRGYAALGGEGPSPESDAHILAQARRAAKVRSLPVPRRKLKWTTPLALAATVIISFSLVMSVVREVETPAPARESSADIAELYESADEMRTLNSPAVSQAGAIESGVADSLGRSNEAKAKVQAEQLQHDLSGPAEMEEELIYPTSMAPAARTMATILPGELETAVDTIRTYLDTGLPGRKSRDMDVVADAKKPAGKSSFAATATEKDQYTVPERQLEEILTLYDTNQFEAAVAAISDFRSRHPDHPVSVQLLDSEN